MLECTNCFINRDAAVRYFSFVHSARMVDFKIKMGDVVIGKPDHIPGAAIELNEAEGRYYYDKRS